MADDFFLFGSAPQSEGQTVFNTPATLGEYLDAQQERTFEGTYTRLLEQWVTRPEGGALLQKQYAEEAAKNIGVKIDIPESGIDYNSFVFNVARQLKLQQLDRTIARKPDGFVSSALGVGVTIGTELVDPIGMVSNFIPMVGPARYASVLSKTATTTGRAAARFGLGAAEGAIATAALEPLSYSLANSLGDDYTAYDSFLNVAFGSGFGGAFSSGGGLIADAWGGKLGGISTAIPKKERNEILQAATHAFIRDGDVDVDAILNAATRKNLLYNLNEVPTIPGLSRQVNDLGPVAVAKERARIEYLKDKPDLAAKVSELELKLNRRKELPKNIYERALNEYSDAKKIEVKTAADQVLVDKKISSLEKRYGKDFEKEANDYIVYESKRDKLENGAPDNRQRKTLEKDLASLDSKYSGRLSDAYNKKKSHNIESDAEYVSARNELDQLNAEQYLGVEMKYFDMMDQAERSYQEAINNFASSYSTKQSEMIDRDFVSVQDEIKKAVELNAVDEIDDIISDVKALNDAFEQRTGIVVEEIDDSIYDVSNIIGAMKNFANCIRR